MGAGHDTLETESVHITPLREKPSGGPGMGWERGERAKKEKSKERELELGEIGPELSCLRTFVFSDSRGRLHTARKSGLRRKWNRRHSTRTLSCGVQIEAQELKEKLNSEPRERKQHTQISPDGHFTYLCTTVLTELLFFLKTKDKKKKEKKKTKKNRRTEAN